jgi:hypothetical protein
VALPMRTRQRRKSISIKSRKLEKILFQILRNFQAKDPRIPTFRMQERRYSLLVVILVQIGLFVILSLFVRSPTSVVYLQPTQFKREETRFIKNREPELEASLEELYNRIMILESNQLHLEAKLDQSTIYINPGNPDLIVKSTTTIPFKIRIHPVGVDIYVSSSIQSEGKWEGSITNLISEIFASNPPAQVQHFPLNI